MRAAGIAPDPALQQGAVSSEASGYAAARSLLDSGRSFDAIFAASDLIAIGAMRALAEAGLRRSEEHTSELQSLMRLSYAVFCLKKTQLQSIHQHVKKINSSEKNI